MKNILQDILNGDRIGLADIGASGGVEPRWEAVKDLLQCFLFEPDKRSHENLIETGADKVFGVALGDKVEEAKLNLCRKPEASSRLDPNLDFAGRFPDAARWEVVRHETLSFTTLDRIESENNLDIDFIKLDVQGGEYAVLVGADRVLQGPVIGLEVEVEFLPLYKQQPLFGNITEILSEKGFEFFDFVNLYRWQRDQFSNYGQNVFGDALFLKPPEMFAADLDKVSLELAKKKARRYIVVCALYDRADLLPICSRLFAAYLDTAAIRLIKDLEALMGARRKKIDFILRVADRFLRSLGFRAMPLQWR